MGIAVRRMAIVLAVAGLAPAGCVSSRTFDEAQQKAYTQHQEDQRQLLALATTNRRLSQQVDDLERALQSAKEQVTRSERERKEARDELLKLKIEREQQPDRRRERVFDTGDEARLRDRLDEAKRRIREGLQQLQGILEQF